MIGEEAQWIIYRQPSNGANIYCSVLPSVNNYKLGHSNLTRLEEKQSKQESSKGKIHSATQSLLLSISDTTLQKHQSPRLHVIRQSNQIRSKNKTNNIKYEKLSPLTHKSES